MTFNTLSLLNIVAFGFMVLVTTSNGNMLFNLKRNPEKSLEISRQSEHHENMEQMSSSNGNDGTGTPGLVHGHGRLPASSHGTSEILNSTSHLSQEAAAATSSLDDDSSAKRGTTFLVLVSSLLIGLLMIPFTVQLISYPIGWYARMSFNRPLVQNYLAGRPGNNTAVVNDGRFILDCVDKNGDWIEYISCKILNHGRGLTIIRNWVETFFRLVEFVFS